MFISVSLSASYVCSYTWNDIQFKIYSPTFITPYADIKQPKNRRYLYCNTLWLLQALYGVNSGIPSVGEFGYCRLQAIYDVNSGILSVGEWIDLSEYEVARRLIAE